MTGIKGSPTKNPIIHLAPALFARLRVQPIHGTDFGTQVRVSLLLK